VGLTSIAWREAWKYGERAFRYCQHDVGHAFAALRYAAAVLGWRMELLPEWNDAQLARLLGLDRSEDFTNAERETPELLVRVMVNQAAGPTPSPVANAPVEWFGRANRLSSSHVGWPVIDEAIAVSERKASITDKSFVPESWPPPSAPACAHSSGQLIRRRRSAVDFDESPASRAKSFWPFWILRYRARPFRRLMLGRFRLRYIWFCSFTGSRDWIPACISGCARRPTWKLYGLPSMPFAIGKSCGIRRP